MPNDTKTSAKYIVGQVVHKVTQPNNTFGDASHADITITKIGRKWAFYKEMSWEGKFCIKDTSDHDEGVVYAGDFCSRERVYLSRRHYDDDMELKSLMADLHSKLPRVPRDGVTAQNIKDAAAILKIELEK